MRNILIYVYAKIKAFSYSGSRQGQPFGWDPKFCLGTFYWDRFIEFLVLCESIKQTVLALLLTLDWVAFQPLHILRDITLQVLTIRGQNRLLFSIYFDNWCPQEQVNLSWPNDVCMSCRNGARFIYKMACKLFRTEQLYEDIIIS